MAIEGPPSFCEMKWYQREGRKFQLPHTSACEDPVISPCSHQEGLGPASGTTSRSPFMTKIHQNYHSESQFLKRIYGFCLDANTVMEGEALGGDAVLQVWRREWDSYQVTRHSFSGANLGKGTKSHLISSDKQQDTDTPSGARALCSSPASGSNPALAISAGPWWDFNTSIPWLPLSSWKRNFFKQHHSAPVSHSAA